MFSESIDNVASFQFLVILLILSLCIASSVANRCANLGLYTLPDENSCTKYYICLHGQELANECAEGLFFDPTTGNCNLESRTVCLLASCPVDNVGSLSLVPSYENCSKYMPEQFWIRLRKLIYLFVSYYACIRGIASRMSCSEGLLYNPEKKACDFAERVTCAVWTCAQSDCWFLFFLNFYLLISQLPISKQTYTIADCPLTGAAKLPHNEDCSKFYVCVNGRSSEYNCAAGSLYNPKNKRCDRPEKTKCFNA